MRTLLLLALLTLSHATSAAPAGQDLRALETRLLALINQERQANGAPPVRMNEKLCEVARAHSRDMRDRGFFAHLTPEGRTPLDRALAGGIRFVRIGENLALDRDVETPHRTMMAEPPGERNHRSCLLNPKYTEVGIGIETNGEWLYISEEFITPGTAEEGEWETGGVLSANAKSLDERLNTLTGNLARMNEKLARIALLANDPKQALDSFQEALKQDARCAGAYEGIGEANERLGKPDAAREAYSSAVRLNPDDATARRRLAELLLAAGKASEALPHFYACTRLQPGDALAWLATARCAAAAGRKEEARDLLHRAVKLDPSLAGKARAEPALAPLLE